MRSKCNQKYLTATKYWKMTITNCAIILADRSVWMWITYYSLRDKYYTFPNRDVRLFRANLLCIVCDVILL